MHTATKPEEPANETLMYTRQEAGAERLRCAPEERDDDHCAVRAVRDMRSHTLQNGAAPPSRQAKLGLNHKREKIVVYSHLSVGN